MIFQRTITTPKNTTIAAPLRTILKVTYGVVYRLEIQLPFGNVGLLGVRIFDHTNQIYPSTNGEYFTGQGVLLAYDDKYNKFTEPFEFEIETYNLDDTYEHKAIIRIGMAVTNDEIASLFPSRQVSSLAESLAAQTAETVSTRRSILKRAIDLVTGTGG